MQLNELWLYLKKPQSPIHSIWFAEECKFKALNKAETPTMVFGKNTALLYYHVADASSSFSIEGMPLRRYIARRGCLASIGDFGQTMSRLCQRSASPFWCTKKWRWHSTFKLQRKQNRQPDRYTFSPLYTNEQNTKAAAANLCNLLVVAVIFFPFYRFFIHEKEQGKKDPATLGRCVEDLPCWYSGARL